jgi:hypothetical protein
MVSKLTTDSNFEYAYIYFPNCYLRLFSSQNQIVGKTLVDQSLCYFIACGEFHT